MQLTYAFFAKAAQVSEDGLLGIIGGDVQSLEGSIPYQPDALTLVAKVEFRGEDCGRPHSFHLAIIDPNGRTTVREPLEITPPPVAKQGGVVGAIFLFGLEDVTFDQPGSFRFRLVMNGRVLAELPLAIHAEVGATVTG